MGSASLHQCEDRSDVVNLNESLATIAVSLGEVQIAALATQLATQPERLLLSSVDQLFASLAANVEGGQQSSLLGLDHVVLDNWLQLSRGQRYRGAYRRGHHPKPSQIT